jgi:hypothetical protein
MIILTNRVNQLTLALGVMKLDNSLPVQRTITDIMTASHVIPHKEAMCLFLKYLAEEYAKVRSDLIPKIEHEDDPDEKDRMTSIISEIDNIMNLSNMVSGESSLEYMVQIFNEICVGVRKIKSL